jgi:hypothetical protein
MMAISPLMIEPCVVKGYIVYVVFTRCCPMVVDVLTVAEKMFCIGGKFTGSEFAPVVD